jgi:hypothetical protein
LSTNVAQQRKKIIFIVSRVLRIDPGGGSERHQGIFC